MAGMCRHLRHHGYETWSRTYPSRSTGLDDLADLVARWITDDLGPDARPLAVTHSLGGVLARLVSPKVQFSRIVMLAPPNGGSHLANELGDWPLFQRIFGPAGTQLRSAGDWPIPPCPTAVVAGTLAPSIGNPVSWVTAGLRTFQPDAEHDGTVALEETRLAGMAQFHKVAASHTWIMNHAATRQITLDFLRSD